MEFVKGWIQNIVLVVVLASFLEMILPNSSFKKYVSMVVGFLVIAAILQPISSLFSGSLQVSEVFQNHELTIEQKSLQNSQGSYNDVQKKQLVSLYKEKLSNQILDWFKKEKIAVKSLDVEINQDTSSEEFGVVKKLEVVISDQGKQKEGNMIQKVFIPKIDLSKKGNKNPQEKDTENSITKNIKNSLSNVYNLSPTNIHVIVQKS